MNVKKMAVPITILLVMMVAAIFVMQAAAFTAPNANDDRVEFAYSEGNCNGLYVNERPNCTTYYGPKMSTLRIYGEDSIDAAFPYTDPEGPFDPTNSEAPGKDFVVFNPAYMEEQCLGDSITVDSNDSNEKIFARQWYVPKYPEPRGDVWADQPTVNSADIVTEYSYMLLDTNNMPAAGHAASGTCFWFPIGSRGGRIGLDSFNLTTGSWNVDDPTIVRVKNISDYNSDGMKDMTIETKTPVRLYDTGEWIEFLDHRIYVKDVTQVTGDAWAATVDVYYIGNDNEELIDSNVDIVVGASPMAFGRHYNPSKTLDFSRPWYIEATSHTREQINGTWCDSVKVVVGRRLHMNETFFVDGAEYDIPMIYGPTPDTFKYITLRNPTPKCITEDGTVIQGNITLPVLSITKTCVPSCEVMPMLPPFNMDHTMIDDINLPDCYTGCPGAACDNMIDDPTSIMDRDFSVGPLNVKWYDEAIEQRFHTNLLEILKEPEEIWQWIHIRIMPNQYTEMVYPPLPDATVCSTPSVTLPGDFLLVSSWEAPNSCGDRMKFAYDADDSSDIYVNEQNRCGNNSVRIYGEDSVDAAFPYNDPEGPFNKLSNDTPRKDFVTFNPAYMKEHCLDDSITVDGNDANEKTFVRQWYVPEYPEPRGDVWADQPTVNSADIVTEYSYMLLDTNNMPAAGHAASGTCFWFPIGSKGGQIGLDSFNLTTGGTWNVGDPTIVKVKDIGDYNSDGMKDMTIETRDPVRLYDTSPAEWIEFLDHRIYVRDVTQVTGNAWAATVDVYYTGNDNKESIESNVDIVVGAGPVAFGRHYNSSKTLDFSRPWYIEATSHTREQINGTWYDSVKVVVGRRLHMNETFFVDGAEYDIPMIYGPTSDTFKYITLRNPTPKYDPVDLPVLSITKQPVLECDEEPGTTDDVLPMLPPFNMVHDIVDDIGIPHYKHGLGDTIRDEPDGIKSCADTVAERIVTNQPPFVSYFVDEDVETRFKTNLLEILDESDPEGWNMLCTWTLPWSYTAMVYPDVGDMTCGSTPVPDADFIVTTSGPANYTSPPPTRLEGDVNNDTVIDSGDALLIARHIVGLTTLTGDDFLAADVDDNGTVDAADALYMARYLVHLITTFPGGQYIP